MSSTSTIYRSREHHCCSSISGYSNSYMTCRRCTTSCTSRTISKTVLSIVVGAPKVLRSVIGSSGNGNPYRGSVRSIRVRTTRYNSR